MLCIMLRGAGGKVEGVSEHDVTKDKKPKLEEIEASDPIQMLY